MNLLAFEDAFDIGRGRGRLALKPALSFFRIDVRLGHAADVNEAWRSPEDANANYAAWIAYQSGIGPPAPRALPAWESIHCRGFAVDSGDWYDDRSADIWRDNGWRQTARDPDPDRDEPWHGEYFEHLDNHIDEPTSRGAALLSPREEDMPKYVMVKDDRGNFALIGPDGVGRIVTGAALRGAQKIAIVANGGTLPEVELSGEEWDAATLTAFRNR